MKKTQLPKAKKTKPKTSRSKSPTPGMPAALKQAKSLDWWLVVGVDKEITETGKLRDVAISVRVPAKPRDVAHAIELVSALPNAVIKIPQGRSGARLICRPKMPGMRAAILFAHLGGLEMPSTATEKLIASELAECGISLETRSIKGPTNAQLQEMAKKNKPPQSWYDEDFTGLF